jgi:hypothetical protein
MICIREVLGIILLFSSIYIILYIDHRLHKKCKCKDCYMSSNKISLIIPLVLTIIGFIIYKIAKPYIMPYIVDCTINKQDVITDMANF